jgi:signal transduction histidine kinase
MLQYFAVFVVNEGGVSVSLGLPSHVAPRALNRALERAGHAIALAVLVCAGFIMLAFAASRPDLLLWPALLAVVCMILALWHTDKVRSTSSAIVYLVVGSIATYVYILVICIELPELVGSPVPWLALPKIALIMASGVSSGLFQAFGWAMIGYVLGELSALIAFSQVGLSPEFDGMAFGTLVAISAVALLGFLAAKLAHQSQPRLHRAAREELLDDIRARMELRAAALMHDTILSHLAAIANSRADSLSASQMAEIERDMQILTGQEWLQDAEPAGESRADWQSTPLNAAIQDAQKQGLEISGTGDFVAVTRLDRARSTALGLAVKQCLVNVIKHSGVMKAEVAVYGSATDVSVMVIDEGNGFVDTSVGADRMGLRTSVRRRIESVGGMVQVWSTPGSGTSILLQLPVAGEPAGPSAGSDRAEGSSLSGVAEDAS